MSSLLLKNRELAELEFNDVSAAEVEKLDCSNNLLTSLSGVQKCTNLKWLNAPKNQINSIKHIKNLTSLNVLNLGNNKLLSISHLIKLKNLKALILNNNEIESVSALGMMKELNTLVISYNKLTELDVSMLPSLMKFSASHNWLTTVPNLQAQKDVRELRLNDNQIKELPIWLVPTCKKLKLIDLGNNELQNMDAISCLGQLPFLENLNLRGNPLVDTTEGFFGKMKQVFPNLKICNGTKLGESYFKELQGIRGGSIKHKVESKEKEPTNQSTKTNESSKENPNSLDTKSSKERGFKMKSFGESSEIKLKSIENDEHATSEHVETEQKKKKKKKEKMKTAENTKIEDNSAPEHNTVQGISNSGVPMDISNENEMDTKKKKKKKKVQELETQNSKTIDTFYDTTQTKSIKKKKKFKKSAEDINSIAEQELQIVTSRSNNVLLETSAVHRKRKRDEKNTEDIPVKPKKKKEIKKPEDKLKKKTGVVSINKVRTQNKKSSKAAVDFLLKTSDSAYNISAW